MNQIKKMAIVFAVLMLPAYCFAQPDPFEEDAEDVPIDGGVSLLIAAGIGYGAKRLYKATAKDTCNDEVEK